MSDMLETLKQARSGGKSSVTKSAKRVKDAISRGSDKEIVKSLMVELEKAFSDFCELDDEYSELVNSDPGYAEHKVVNGQDLKEYVATVTSCYKEASELYANMNVTGTQNVLEHDTTDAESATNLETLKKARTSGKSSVTKNANRVKGALHRGSDMEIVTGMMIELEKSFSDFCDINDEYCELVNSDPRYSEHSVVNGQDLNQYAETVSLAYAEVSELFNNAKAAHNQIAQNISRKARSPGTSTENAGVQFSDHWNRKMEQLETLMGQIDFNLNSPDVNLSSLDYDKDRLDPMLKSFDSLISEMKSLNIDPTEISSKVDELNLIQTAASELKKRVVLAKSMLSPTIPVTSDSPSMTQRSTPTIQRSQENDSHTATSMGSNRQFGVHNSVQNTMTPLSSGHVSGGSTMMTGTSSPFSMRNSLGVQSTVQNPVMTPLSSGHGSGGPMMMPTGINSPFSLQNPVQNPQSVGSPVMSTGIQSTPYSMQGYPNSSIPITSMNPGPQPYGVPWSGGNQQYAMGYPPPMMYNATPFNPWQQFPPGMNQQSRNAGEVRLEKISLPTFSGQRSDWPEFKTVWKNLAERHYTNKTALAHQLKKAVSGEAKQRIKCVYITKPDAYEQMWTKLEAYYDDKSASIQAALEGLSTLKSVVQDDYRALVQLVDAVEIAYCQLDELGNLDALTTRDVDKICALLPSQLRSDWNRNFFDLTPLEKIKPMPKFMSFLRRERNAVSRLAEAQKQKPKFQVQKSEPWKGVSNQRARAQVNHAESSMGKTPKKFYSCAVPAHRREDIKHNTETCREFLKLPIKGKGGRVDVLKDVNACFYCFGNHKRGRCPKKADCTKCNKGHHVLICSEVEDKGPRKTEEASGPTATAEAETATVSALSVPVTCETNLNRSPDLALYAIMQASVAGTRKKATVFMDNGSNTSYVTRQAADRLKLKRTYHFSLDVTTMGNVHTEYDSWQYEVPFITKTGEKVVTYAYSMERITGPVSKLDLKVLAKLFPEYDPESLQRKSTTVDVLLGSEYFGLHPKHEIAAAGKNLSIMEGAFGICVQGSHPELKEETKLDCNLAKTVHRAVLKGESFHTMSRRSVFDSKVETFIKGDELATETNVKCGSCRCGKCPVTGQTYSFKEEQELKMIQEGLEYDAEQRCWITSYPWLKDPSQLPDNYQTVLGTLRSTERRLEKDKVCADAFEEQIQDMLKRGVARRLTAEELAEWNGPKFYLSPLVVYNPKSNSTPVRAVFNSSQLHKGVSLNSCLAKGPDCYINNLLGVLLRWREEAVALVGDIKKMFNSVHLKALEQHCHRFLWRNLDTSKAPDVYVITRVNFGDRPSPAISSEAIYKTAEKFQTDSPEAAQLLLKSTYVDDMIDSFKDKACTLKIAGETESMLLKGGFKVKCWQISGEDYCRSAGELEDSVSEVSNSSNKSRLLKGSEESTSVLGMDWKPKEDVMVFKVSLNFSPKKKGSRTGKNLTAEEVPRSIPMVLSRRIVLEQSMGIYDPMGLICPFILISKIYLRETWQLDALKWDDPLPPSLRDKWVHFFKSMFELEHLAFSRSLRPESAVGKPWLIVLSDGSDLAYGCAAYVRWKLENGEYWCRLVMAKCRIAPVNRVSTPQMELNGAVLSKRVRNFVEDESRYDFEKIIQIVDSETVLNMINKTSTRFKVYEGVRLGEIQAATKGDVSCWAWIAGEKNTADWVTRGKSPKALDESSEWWNGPPVLYKPFEEWGLKFGTQREEVLPGEKKIVATFEIETLANSPIIVYTRYSDVSKLIRVLARVHSIFRCKSFGGGKMSVVTVDDYRKAEESIVRDMQKEFTSDMMKKKGGRYGSLNPMKNAKGIWVVGARLYNNNVTTADSAQKLVPTNHPGTRLFMARAHKEGHLGQNSTLNKFRKHFWSPNGDKIAKSVKFRCALCKRREAVLLSQQMGPLPEARLKPAPPFNKTMLDLFGPYSVRGEVQKRTTGKAYGVIFTDLASRAVHIEAVFGYDTSSFLLALRRFSAIRGWPEVIYSDPGSQLVGASNELEEAWKNMDKDMLRSVGLEKGTTWVFGPADSPWHQGAAESLIRSTKRAIHFAVHNQRLSVPEFLTICTEAANLLNERPIGTRPSPDSEINILTPNNLLIGRSDASNPGEFVSNVESLRDRFRLVEYVISQFWKNWTNLYAPTLVKQTKWKYPSRDLCPGDVVLVADSNVHRGEYRLAEVVEVFSGTDNKVRQATVSYKNYRAGEKLHEYKGAKPTIVKRSVQRLALLIPVEERSQS